jgi:hypothetical protein
VYTIDLSSGQDLTGENFGDYKGATRAIASAARPGAPFAIGGNPVAFTDLQADMSALLFGIQNLQGVFAD